MGRSKAHDRPVWPAASRNLNRSFVASALPKPAYWRIVQSRPRYISVDAAGVGRRAGAAELRVRDPAGEVLGRVHGPDVDAGIGAAHVVSHGPEG